MPRFDGTGPMGMGRLTGRGMGGCGCGMMGCGFGGGLGRGMRRGFGRGLAGFYAYGRTLSKDEEKENLENYRKALEEELESVKEVLAEF